MTDDRRDTRIDKNRLEALVDGIFAFAMTLLVTGLVIPNLSKTEAQSALAGTIAGMRHELISFLVAFFVLASFWHVHNRQFHFIRRVDGGILSITLLILAGVVLMPFTTNVSGDYSEVQVAVVLFHGNMLCLGLLFLIHWWYLTRTPDITTAAISDRDAAYGMRRCLIVPAVSALGFAFSFISPAWSMTSYLLILPASVLAGKYPQGTGSGG